MSKQVLTITVEQPSQQQLTEAIKQVTRDLQITAIRTQMIEMCYTDEEIRQTKAAAKEFKRACPKGALKYPLAITYISGEYELRFYLTRYITNILEEQDE